MTTKSNNKYPDWIKLKSERMMFDDFRVFLFFIWKHLGLSAPTPLQYSIADYLQNGDRRRIIQAFRGCGKSWITAAFVLWLLWKNPQVKILVVSASKERADAFSIFVKRLIEDIEMLQFLSPRAGQRDSNLAFDVAPAKPDQSPSVKSAGITGQITGSRADYIIADDIEVPNNSMTEDQREKLATRVTEFDAILKPKGHIVALGTPQTAQSLYNLLETKGYKTQIWPVHFTDGLDDEGRDKYNGNLSKYILDLVSADPTIIGNSVEPTRFDNQDLAERAASYGRSGFALQFLLDTSLNDANRYPLKIKDLIVMDLDKEVAPVQLTYASGLPQVIEGIPNVGMNGDRLFSPMYVSDAHVPYQSTAMFIDPSGRGADECAYVVIKFLNGMLFCSGWSGVRGSGYDESTLLALALIAKSHGVNEVHAESNFGDGMFNALFAPVLNKIHPCALEEYRVNTQKEARIIDTLEPVLNQHRLVLDKSVAMHNSECDPSGSAVRAGLYQLAHITRDRGSLKHDDRLDVLAAAVKHFVEHMSVSGDNSEKEHLDREREKVLAEFARTWGLGSNNNNQNYVGRR